MAILFNNGTSIGQVDPNQQFTVTDVGQKMGLKSRRQKRQSFGEATGTGIVGDIIEGFASPFAETYLDAGEQVARAGNVLQGKENTDQAQFQTQDIYEDYQKNPALRRVQNLAGMAAAFIPGSGVAKAALQGGLQGFSAARGTDEEGKADIGSTLASAGIGALAGGALAKGGELASDFIKGGGAKAATEVAEQAKVPPVEKLKFNPDNSASQSAAELAETLQTETPQLGGKLGRAQKALNRAVAKSEGITGGEANRVGQNYAGALDTSENTLRKAADYFDVKYDNAHLPELFEKTEPIKTKLLAEFDQVPKYTATDTADNLGKQITDGVLANKSDTSTLGSDEAKSMVERRLGQLIDGYDEASLQNQQIAVKPSQMEAIKKEATGGYLKAEYGKGKVSPQDLADAEIYKLFSGKLNQIEGFRPINQVREQLILNSEGLRRNFLTGTGNIRSASVLRNPLSKVIDAVQKPVMRTAANVLNRAAEGGSMVPGLPGLNIPAPIVNTGANILSQVGANPAARLAIERGLTNSTPTSAMTQPAPTQNVVPQDRNSLAMPPPRTQYDDLIELVRGGVDVNTAQNILKQIGAQNAKAKPLSATDRKLQSTIRSGLKALDDIESISGSDSAALLTGNLPAFVQSSNARKLNTAISQAADSIGRLRSGGAINKAEEERFREMLPVWTDDAETKAYKIQSLRQVLSDALTRDDLSTNSELV